MKTKYYLWLVQDTATQLLGSLRSFALPLLVVLALGSNSKAGVLSALAAGIAGFLTLFGGYLTDHYERRKLLIFSTSFSTVVYLVAVIWLSFNTVTWSFLVLVAVASAIWFGLFSQVSNVFLRNLVAKEELPKAISVNQMRDGVVELSSGPLAGFLLSLGAIFPFITNLFLSIGGLFASVCLPKQSSHLVSSQQPSGAGKHKFKKLVMDAIGGVTIILGNPVLIVSALISTLYFPFLNGFIFLMVLDSVSNGNSLLSAASFNSMVALGVIAGSLVATKLVDTVPTGKLIIATLLIPIFLGTGVVLVDNFYVKLGLLLLILFLLPAGNASFGGFLMVVVPDEFLGRVFAVNQVMSLVVTPLVSLSVGFGLDYLGLKVTGLSLLTVMLLISVLAVRKELRLIPLPTQWETYLESMKIGQEVQ